MTKDYRFLTDIQKKVLDKLRSEGTAKFTRNDYQVLATIKHNCKIILSNFEDALSLYLELSR